MNAQGKITATKAGKVTTMTSREFNQHTGEAKSAAANGPVIITDRGKPAYVLLSNEHYERLANDGALKDKAGFVSILDALTDPNYSPDDPDLMDFIPPRTLYPPRDPFADE
ncbi:MAG: type II toxin-antitoxin system prevent-host-death family antitoxin [Devosia sp.]